MSRRYSGLIGVLGANAASLSAARVLSVALPWFVLTTTGSVTKTGLVVFCQMAPYVVVQALAGPIIDRIGPKRISIAGDLVSTAAMVVAPILFHAGALPLGALMALMAVVGVADGPSNGAKGVFVPVATRAAGVPLERGTGLSGAVERTATTIGPAIAGVVVAAFGSVDALFVTAGLFALSAIVVATVVPDTDRAAEPAVGEPEGYLNRLRDGATFLRKERLLRAIAGMLAATNLLDQAFIAVLLPAWARAAGYGPGAVGLVISVFAAASILAALTAAAIANRLPRRTVYLVGFIIGGIPRFAAMATGVPLWAVLGVLAIGGLGSGFINPVIGAVTYERIPVAMMGRVRTLTQAISWSGIPFGGLVGAGLVGLAGLTGALWVVGGLYLLAIVVPGMSREWSSMNAPVPRPRGAGDRDESVVVDQPA